MTHEEIKSSLEIIQQYDFTIELGIKLNPLKWNGVHISGNVHGGFKGFIIQVLGVSFLIGFEFPIKYNDDAYPLAFNPITDEPIINSEP